MTDDPIWPGVAEYLYHAASLARVVSDGTWSVPSRLTPRCSSLACTPMAGMSTATGNERRSDGPWPLPGPVAPAADAGGCGACIWAAIATPMTRAPPMIRRAPASPAARARRLTGMLGGGAHPVCGQDMTTRNPAMRRHSISPTAANPPSVIFPAMFCARNLLFSDQVIACLRAHAFIGGA